MGEEGRRNWLQAFVVIFVLVNSERVFGLLKIVSPEQNPYYVLRGQDFELECHCDDANAVDIQLGWVRNQGQDELQHSHQDGTAVTTEMVDNVRISRFKKFDAALYDTSDYVCKTENQQESQPLLVSVFDIDTTVDAEAAATPGEDLQLQCLLEGKLLAESPKLHWFDDSSGAEITNDGEKFFINDLNGTLVVKRFALGDLHDYVCEFVFGDGQTLNSTIEVISKPHISKDSGRSVNKAEDESVELECHAWGLPVPTFQWLKGDFPLNESERVSFRNESGNDGLTVSSYVRIEDLVQSDRDDYMCVADNSKGSYNSTVLLRVKDKLAALYPFLGICVELILLFLIIFFCNRRKEKDGDENNKHDEDGQPASVNGRKGKGKKGDAAAASTAAAAAAGEKKDSRRRK